MPDRKHIWGYQKRYQVTRQALVILIASWLLASNPAINVSFRRSLAMKNSAAVVSYLIHKQEEATLLFDKASGATPCRQVSLSKHGSLLPAVVSMSLSKAGSPLAVLSNSTAYAYQPSMRTWMRVVDSDFALSSYASILASGVPGESAEQQPKSHAL